MDSATLIQIAVLFGVMFILLFAKVPIFLSLAGASIAYALIFPGNVPVAVFAKTLAQGIGKESYAAILFYFLLGEIMNSGGIS